MYQNIVARFNAISFTIITGLCVLLPFFFLPASLSGLGPVKGALLYGGVLLAFSFWILSQFVDGNFKVSRDKTLLILGGWVLLVLISAFTSANAGVSLWGRGFVIDSFATTLMLALFAFLVATYAREQRKLIKLFLAAFSGSVITILLQIVLFLSHNTPFVSTYLSHVASQGTLVGSWVDFSHFVTFTFVLALLMYEVLMPRGFFKFLSLLAMTLSVVALAFLNFKTAWVITIVASLLVFVYKSSVERSLSRFFGSVSPEISEERPAQFPLLSFSALLIGLFFFLASSSVGVGLSRLAGVNFADIRPSFSATTHVLRATLSHDPIFGAGAGRFGEIWNLYHPIGINQTIFWNTSFDTGFSWVWTHIATNGILAGLLFIGLFVYAIVVGFKLFNYSYPDHFSRFIAVTALIMLIAFFALIVLGAPGLVLITYGFMYLGILVGVGTLAGRTPVASFHYLRDPRLSFFAILLLVVTAMVGFSSVYFVGNRFASVVFYNKAIGAKDFTVAESRINRAITHSPIDVYWRARAALYTSRFATEAQKESVDKTALQSYFTQAEQSAQAAVAWDRTSASNWLGLSQVYRLIAGGQGEEAYNNAKSAADEAHKRNPLNPSYVLNKAQIALAKQNIETANAEIDAALSLKPDYLDAFVLRAQIKAAQGNPQGAKQEIVNYTKAAPFDAQGYVLLGSAELDLKNYQSALDAFAQARALAPGNPSIFLQYVNTLTTMGRRSDAVRELEAFKTRYPQVQGVQEQIDRLKKADATPVSSEETIKE